MGQWKIINPKHSARWQHISPLNLVRLALLVKEIIIIKNSTTYAYELMVPSLAGDRA
jgi:hypothetical protein